MPFTQPNGVTPNRQTVIRTNIPEVTISRPTFHLSRKGKYIKPTRQPGFPGSHDVHYQPTDVWTLAIADSDLSKMIFSTGRTIPLAPSEVTIPIGITPHFGFKPPSGVDMEVNPGVVPGGSVIMYTKEVSKGASWKLDSKLTVDEASFPMPNLDVGEVASIAFDRVLASNITLWENCPIGFLGRLPNNWAGLDYLYRVYFGGPTLVQQPGKVGGTWALTVRGNGTVDLHEADPAASGGWVKRKSFKWSADTFAVHGNYFLGVVQPHGWDLMSLAFGGLWLATDSGPLGLLTSLAVDVLGGFRFAQYGYADELRITGHEHSAYMSGAGPVRVDIRRDLRTPFMIFRMLYPISPGKVGVLTDGPIRVPWVLPSGTPISVKATGYAPGNSSLSWLCYNAATGALLPTNSSGQFLSDGGNTFFVQFTFASSDGRQTAILESYDFDVPGIYAALAPIPQTIYGVTGVNIVGPDIDPDHDRAQLEVEDTINAGQIFKVRDKVKTEVLCIDPRTGTIVSRIFEGDTFENDAEWRGKAQHPLFLQNWTRYGPLGIIGMWNRCAEQPGLDLEDFSQDPTAPKDPATGKQLELPWKITDILRKIMNKCGFRDDELDIPDLPQRLWPSAEGAQDDWLLQPGAGYARFILKMTHSYLGRPFVRDPNAGVRGMWRLLPFPDPTNIVATFYLTPPPFVSLPGPIHHPGRYSGNSTFIRTWKTRVKAPEINYVAVSTVGEILPDDTSAKMQYSQFFYNPLSFDWPGMPSFSNPNHPDYRGHMVPGFIYDPGLGTQEACDFLARRTMDFAGHAEKWAFFTSPLLLIRDPHDALQNYFRPLRINDTVQVRYGPNASLSALMTMRNANPQYRHDANQWCYQEAKFVNTTTGI